MSRERSAERVKRKNWGQIWSWLSLGDWTVSDPKLTLWESLTCLAPQASPRKRANHHINNFLFYFLSVQTQLDVLFLGVTLLKGILYRWGVSQSLDWWSWLWYCRCLGLCPSLSCCLLRAAGSSYPPGWGPCLSIDQYVKEITAHILEWVSAIIQEQTEVMTSVFIFRHFAPSFLLHNSLALNFNQFQDNNGRFYAALHR